MSNKYSLSETVKNVYSLVMTKITFHQARLIRRPIYIRGAKSIEGAQQLTTGRFCRFDLVGNRKTLYIGNNCEFGDMTHIVAHDEVRIGNNVLLASKVFISDTNHGTYTGIEQSSPETIPKERKLVSKKVQIGNNVWIGENVVILAGSSIGNGCIVGANSVVKGQFGDNEMIVGAPAKTIKIWSKETNTWEVRI